MDQRRQELRRSLGEFYCALLPGLARLEQERRVEDLSVAARFSVFEFFRPDENAISRVIAELLKADGKHGQGSVFLEEFLKVIGHSELSVATRHVRVKYQHPADWIRDRGFIDITVELDGFGIGIENKPFAGELKDQLSRYRKHLEKKYKGRFCLVFLGGRKQVPESISEAEQRQLEAEGKFKVLSYQRELRDWLETCAEQSKGEKVRWFFRDFVRFLESDFRAIEEEGGVMSDDERELIIQHAFETPERLRIALLVGAACRDIKARLIRKGLAEVRSRIESAAGGDCLFEQDDDLSKGFYFRFRKAKWPQSMVLGFGRDTAGQPLYFYAGRWDAPKSRLPIDNEVAKALSTQLAEGAKPTEWCCWWKYFDRYRNWDSVDTLLDLAKGDEVVDYLAAFLLDMWKVVGPVVEAQLKADAG